MFLYDWVLVVGLFCDNVIFLNFCYIFELMIKYFFWISDMFYLNIRYDLI